MADQNIQSNTPIQDDFFGKFDRNLYRASTDPEGDVINDILNNYGNANANANNGAAVSSDPSDTGSGFGNGTIQNTGGNQQAGKTQFNNTQTGYILGLDSSDGKAKFYIGNTSQYLNWDGNNLTIQGTFVIGGTLITITNIANLQTAINTVSAAGGGTVALVPATYNATTSFTIPSNVAIDGSGATIDFGGGAFQFLIQGSNAYSTGGVTVNFGSTSVTGVGTTWTAGMVGQSILIGDYWYTITARSSNTAITIAPAYRGLSLGMSANYVIATTIDGASVKNITLQNVSGTLLRFRYCNGFQMDGLICTNGGQGIDGDDSANVNWLNSDVDTCTVGITYDQVPFCTFNNGIILDISGGTALALSTVTNTSMGSMSIQKVTGVGLKYTNCSNLGFVNWSIIECTSHGVEFVSGNSDVDLAIGYTNTCGGDGIKLTATSSRISIESTSLLNSTGYGINIANANCSNNNLTANAFTNNTAGNINDSGTSTVISADDTAYAASWNGNLGTPTKNAVYDKIESLSSTPVIDIQTFNASGTWTMPANAKRVVIEAIGGGGGGGGCAASGGSNSYGGGGGGGAYISVELSASQITSPVTITIPAAAAGGIGGNPGAAGGNVTFGTYITGYGGGGGGPNTGKGGGGGGMGSVGSAGDATTGGAGGSPQGGAAGVASFFGGGGGGSITVGALSFYGGGGGGTTASAGGVSTFGGAGGAGGGGPSAGGNTAGGVSTFGGNGGTAPQGGASFGAANVNGGNGVAPGGGGGGSVSTTSATNGGAGALGRIVVTTYF